MKLLCMSDLHGRLLPSKFIDTPADIAVIAGDITPALHSYHGATAEGRDNQARWIVDTFIPWLETLPVRHIVLTWGNHDHVGEHPHLLPRTVWPDHVHVLVNQSVTLDGLSFYGVPQTPRFLNWAFNEDDTEAALGRFWKQVPVGTDVLVSHGPPCGVCDTIQHGEPPLGSRTQLHWLQSEALNRPRVVICGHIHGSGGRDGTCYTTQIYNVAVLNENYQLVRPPKIITLETL